MGFRYNAEAFGGVLARAWTFTCGHITVPD
uniref:Uncharacterized protein n=1 Tax=Anguilla anguilla TaxID=7936 RepID=A0A0E9XQY2_ANGAN